MPWEEAEEKLAGVDQAAEEDRLRGVRAALSGANEMLGDARRHTKSAANTLSDGHRGGLLDVAEACQMAAARMGPATKFLGAIVAALGLARGRKPEVAWKQAQVRLHDFNRPDHETMGGQIDADLAAASESQAQALEKIDEAANALSKNDLVGIAVAGKVAARQAQEYEAVTKLIGGITTATYRLSAAADAYYREFEQLLKGEYRRLALEDDYPAEADAFAELDRVKDLMAEIRLAPRIASRNLCAVAGGFSSGKSSFLNALIGHDLLPTRITPTTSIPTFIFNIKDSGQSVNVFNHHGGSFEVDPEKLRQMTHDFKREFGIELKRLVERVSIYTPKLEAWGNVALIDTPGYTNPDDADGDASDEAVALRSIWQSRFLIWLVDCEKGTLPEQDLGLIKRFLQRRAMANGDEPIYFVLNKADKKPEEERENILKQVVEICDKHEVPYFGIALYSAHYREWYGCERRPFDEFLKAINSAEAVAIEALRDDVAGVFAQYAEYHHDQRIRLSEALGLMKRLGSTLSSDRLVKDLKVHQRTLTRTIENNKKWAAHAAVLQGQFLNAVLGFVTEIRAKRDVL